MADAVSGTAGRAIVTSDTPEGLDRNVAEWQGCGWRNVGERYMPGRGCWAQRMAFTPSGPQPEARDQPPPGYHVSMRAHTARWGWEDMRGWDDDTPSKLSQRDFRTMEAAVADAWKDSERKT